MWFDLDSSHFSFKAFIVLGYQQKREEGTEPSHHPHSRKHPAWPIIGPPHQSGTSVTADRAASTASPHNVRLSVGAGAQRWALWGPDGGAETWNHGRRVGQTSFTVRKSLCVLPFPPVLSPNPRKLLFLFFSFFFARRSFCLFQSVT